MRLSKRGEYALRSLINLGIAAEVGRVLVQTSELAESDQLPAKFLEQILQALKEGGIVASERGKFGGYRLAKPAREIAIGQVVRLIDGPLAPIGCVSQTAYTRCTCPDTRCRGALRSSGQLQSPSLRYGDCRCFARRPQSASGAPKGVLREGIAPVFWAPSGVDIVPCGAS